MFLKFVKSSKIHKWKVHGKSQVPNIQNTSINVPVVFLKISRFEMALFQEKFGDLEVRLEAKTEKSSHIPLGEAGLGRASFSEFFSRYQTDNMYCVSEVA